MKPVGLFAASSAATLIALTLLFFHPAAYASSPFGADVLGLVELLPAAVLTNAAVYTFTAKVREPDFWLARCAVASALAAAILALR